MKLNLVDRDSRRVNAWREAFRAIPEVTVQLGDFLQMITRSPEEVRSLVSSVSWKRKHLDALRREFGDESLFDALFSAFTQNPPLSCADQVALR